MKHFLTALVLFVISQQALAQNSATFKGQLLDTVNKQSMKDASISILDVKDSTVESFSLAKADGSFEIKGFPFGTYIIQINFNSYEPLFKTVTFSKTNPTVDLGTVYLKLAPNELGGVTVKSSPVQVKGDTTEFNAGSFKTKPNATSQPHTFKENEVK